MVLTVSSIRIFPTADPTKSTVPTGGVIVPIPSASIMMIPKWTGSTSIDCTTGKKIGVTMMISGAGLPNLTGPTYLGEPAVGL